MKSLEGNKFEKATLILRGMGGPYIEKIQKVTFKIHPMTISKSGLGIIYTEKGKRKRKFKLIGEKILLNGWDYPNFHTYESTKTKGGLKVKKPLHKTFSDKWNQVIDEYLQNSKAEIIIDGRSEQTEYDSDNSDLSSSKKTSPEESTPKENWHLPEEVEDNHALVEGACIQIMVNAYERNEKARQICLEHYGYDCLACGINMEEKYGHLGKDYIHVHHTKPLAEIGEEYAVNPIKDLKPLCPNCHSMVHRKDPPIKIKELKHIHLD